ncbi:IclR family transcriptional regulator (plasmid) [Methylobacterium currus]|uniref:IclR family transcriptional regulator n=1 Tax=Methylobacterium currus TaxID=2051553 RepID=UPI001E3D2094|nr:IclR family transcriptional regulator [Methylobacterium currus]UHC20079.1 IclR family transcriptional regulator [Methylobacterium currus]
MRTDDEGDGETPPRSGGVDDRLFLQSVARALDVLEAFAASPRPMSLGELAQAAGTNKSAAQRIAQTLLSRGYLEHGRDGGLVPGRRILDRSFDYLRANPLIERAMPVLVELRKAANERVDLSLFDDLTTIYAVRLQSKRETFYATLAGRRVPTFASSGGRACLAQLSDAAVDDILVRSDRRPLTQKTLTEPAKIWRKVKEARRDGYAYATEEALIGEVVLSAAVVAGPDRPLGAVHIAGSLSEWSPEDFRKRFAPLAIEAARALSG